MKGYIKNKGFIPERFYNDIENYKRKKYNNVMSLFIIVNLILMPFTLKSYKESSVGKIVDSDFIINSKDENYILDIENWINTIFNSEINNAYITKSEGEVHIEDIETADIISLNRKIIIDSLNLNDEGKYELHLRLNE